MRGYRLDARIIDGHKNTRPRKGQAKNQARGTTLIPA